MLTKEQIDKLVAFRERDKFSADAWDERGLQPSNSQLCDQLSTSFNQIVDKLVAESSDASQKGLTLILTNGLKMFRKNDYDTEEKEFISDLFF
jgi:hypothetical protein